MRIDVYDPTERQFDTVAIGSETFEGLSVTIRIVVDPAVASVTAFILI